MDSEIQLLRAVIDCLNRVYKERALGLALSKLIASAGCMLFPFLDDDEDALASATLSALKSMMEIDNDVLYGPLLDLSGASIPPCPLKVESKRHQAKTITPSVSSPIGGSNRYQRAVDELLAFADSLPEQTLE
jgi:hypothetical protein